MVCCACGLGYAKSNNRSICEKTQLLPKNFLEILIVLAMVIFNYSPMKVGQAVSMLGSGSLSLLCDEILLFCVCFALKCLGEKLWSQIVCELSI